METEPSLWNQIFQFASAVLPHWWVIITSGIPAALDKGISLGKSHWPQFDKRFHQYLPYKKKIALTAIWLILTILFASFNAWQDNYVALIKAQKREKDALRMAEAATPTGQQERISELERELGASNQKLDSLEMKTQRRHLDGNFLTIAKNFCPTTFPFSISVSPFDNEAVTYANEFIDELTKAKCVAKIVDGLNQAVIGVHIGVRTTVVTPQIKEMSEFLTEEKIQFSYTKMDEDFNKGQQVVLGIGAHP